MTRTPGQFQKHTVEGLTASETTLHFPARLKPGRVAVGFPGADLASVTNHKAKCLKRLWQFAKESLRGTKQPSKVRAFAFWSECRARQIFDNMVENVSL